MLVAMVPCITIVSCITIVPFNRDSVIGMYHFRFIVLKMQVFIMMLVTRCFDLCQNLCKCILVIKPVHKIPIYST